MVGNTLRIQLLEFGVFLGKGTRLATRNLDINRFTTFGSRALWINHLFYSTIEGNVVNVLRHPEIFNHSINWGWKSCAEWWRLERWPARSSVGQVGNLGGYELGLFLVGEIWNISLYIAIVLSTSHGPTNGNRVVTRLWNLEDWWMCGKEKAGQRGPRTGGLSNHLGSHWHVKSPQASGIIQWQGCKHCGLCERGSVGLIWFGWCSFGLLYNSSVVSLFDGLFACLSRSFASGCWLCSITP